MNWLMARLRKRWRQVTIGVEADELDPAVVQLAFRVACDIDDTYSTRNIYYARYGAGESLSIVLKFEIDPYTFKDAECLTWLQDYDRRFVSLKIKRLHSGSEAHARAFDVVRKLKGQGDKQTGDVVHWMLNMLGHSYGDELLFYQERAVDLTRKLLRR